MSCKQPIRTIAVAGGGIVALSAATAFARALPGTEVTIVETSPDPAALADLVPTAWPAATRFHGLIGLEESELVRAGIATHHLGTLFDGWSSSGQPWIHAFGNYGMPAAGVPFDQIWWRAWQAGDALAFDRYSVGAALAGAGKFVHPARDSQSLGSRFEYGLRLDTKSYRERLKEHARSSGVTIVPIDIEAAEPGNQGIAALRLANGSKLEADFYVDCTGPSARLIGTIDDSFEDWSAWMPFDRIELATEPSSDIPATADHVGATYDGWSTQWPLRGRTLRASLSAGGAGVRVTRGRRLRPWADNVLAVGDAATAIDPLHGLNLDLAQRMILLALELLPGREFNPLETQEYNRRADQLTRRVRDFVVLHYLRSGRTTGIWAALRQVQPPDSLAGTLDQYHWRARLPFHEDESISRDSWTAALIGLGVLPAHADPQSEGVPLGKATGAMRQLVTALDETVSRLPSYADYLASLPR